MNLCIPITRPILRIYVVLFRKSFCINEVNEYKQPHAKICILFYTLLPLGCPKMRNRKRNKKGDNKNKRL